MNTEIIILSIFLAIFGLLSIFAISFIFYLHSKVIRLETQINLFTNNSGLPYYESNRREVQPPLTNPKQLSTDKTEKRHLSANNLHSQNPLQKKRADADRKMDEKLGIISKTDDKS